MNTTKHAVIAFSSVPLFLGALLSDWAYSSSFEIQWINFAAWLMAGGLLMLGLAMLWGAIELLFSPAARHRRSMIYLGLLLATFIVGFINSLVHAKDGWSAMPTGLILSAVVIVLAAMASVIGLSGSLRKSS
jgi:uncharacterized membrane protein